MDEIALVISLVALCLSLWTFWTTYFQRGKLVLIRPDTIFFGQNADLDETRFVISFTALLYSSALRPKAVENISAAIIAENGRHDFTNWFTSREKPEKGYGMLIDNSGTLVEVFFAPQDGKTIFDNPDGAHQIEIYAKVAGNSRKTKLLSEKILVGSNFVDRINHRALHGYELNYDHQKKHYTPKGS